MPTISPSLLPILMLFASNVFMTFAWYGHLKFRQDALPLAIMVRWGIAFFEYWLAVPAARRGSRVREGGWGGGSVGGRARRRGGMPAGFGGASGGGGERPSGAGSPNGVRPVGKYQSVAPNE